MSFTSSRPLVRRGDDQYFVANRDAADRLRRGLDDEFNTVVTGSPGTGKTSLLAFVAKQVDDSDRDVHRVPLTAVADVMTAAESIAEAVAGPETEREAPDWTRRDEALMGKVHSKPTPSGRTRSAIGRLCAYLEREVLFDSEHRPDRGEPYIFVDALPRAVASALFTQHADELAEVPATWVVAIGTDGPPTNPAPRFFDNHVHLGGLSGDDAAQIISSRMDVEVPTVISMLDGLQDLTPRDVVTLARDYAGETGDVAKARERRLHAEGRLHALGRPAAMLVAEMRFRGPVSASDDDLLSAMGWKRARASEVLSTLAKASLVTSSEQAGPEGGRPRRLYELVEELK